MSSEVVLIITGLAGAVTTLAAYIGVLYRAEKADLEAELTRVRKRERRLIVLLLRVTEGEEKLADELGKVLGGGNGDV